MADSDLRAMWGTIDRLASVVDGMQKVGGPFDFLTGGSKVPDAWTIPGRTTFHVLNIKNQNGLTYKQKKDCMKDLADEMKEIAKEIAECEATYKVHKKFEKK